MEFKVPKPTTERPNYALPENPTNRQMRETALKAMRDMLTIQWWTAKDIAYNKNGAVNWKDYKHVPGEIYAGLPYADGQTNMFVWLEHYNQETGEVTFNGDGVWFNQNLGNTCAGSLMWGWSAVCRSLTGVFINYNMVQKFGVLPVGDYKYNTEITTYKDHPTRDICDENGIDRMYECYAQIQMADAITSTKTLHTMMSTIDAVVVRTPDGKIDGEKSYITLQDQAAGVGKKFREVEEDGNILHFSGKTDFHAPFQWLWEKAYIPVTTAELAGILPYEKAWIRFEGEKENWLAGEITSNYPMSLLKLFATGEKGERTQIFKLYFNRKDVGTGKARRYAVSQDAEEIQKKLSELSHGSYTVTAEVTASTGEIFYPLTFTYTK